MDILAIETILVKYFANRIYCNWIQQQYDTSLVKMAANYSRYQYVQHENHWHT